MHEALSSLKSTGNNDEDFVQLMLPHHQAAIDIATAELMHGQGSFGLGSTTGKRSKNQNPLLQR